jgi:pimeloyl-ACP methyl ester carboxylesterase
MIRIAKKTEVHYMKFMMSKITKLLSFKSVAGGAGRDGQADQSRRARANALVPWRALIFLVALAVATLAVQNIAHAASSATVAGDSTLVKSGYVDVGGLHMYYEIHGAVHGVDKPLVLLHGGFGNIPSWGPTLTALAQSREVIAFELEGHGRTADLNRPLSWEQMTDDVAAAVRKLGFDQVDVMGYSLGGVMALRMGVKYPSLVRKLVVVSGLYSPAGYYPAINANWPTVQTLAGTPMEREYAQHALNPSQWPIFVGKMDQALKDFKGWPESEVRSIKAPTLLVFGDNDAVRPEYELQLFRMLGGDKAMGGFTPLVNQMAVFPNTTHFSIFVRADLLVPIINPFLDASMPKVKGDNPD